VPAALHIRLQPAKMYCSWHSADLAHLEPRIGQWPLISALWCRAEFGWYCLSGHVLAVQCRYDSFLSENCNFLPPPTFLAHDARRCGRLLVCLFVRLSVSEWEGGLSVLLLVVCCHIAVVIDHVPAVNYERTVWDLYVDKQTAPENLASNDQSFELWRPLSLSLSLSLSLCLSVSKVLAHGTMR